MGRTKRNNYLIAGALILGLLVMGFALINPSQAEPPDLGPGFRTANLDIEGMT